MPPIFEPDFQILIKEDGLFLYFPARDPQQLINLGDPAKVLEMFAKAPDRSPPAPSPNQ